MRKIFAEKFNSKVEDILGLANFEIDFSRFKTIDDLIEYLYTRPNPELKSFIVNKEQRRRLKGLYSYYANKGLK